MRKILFVFLFLLLLAPSIVLAADEFYCKCPEPILAGNRKCLGGFTTTDAAKEACPLCTQLTGDVTADAECNEEVTATTPAATPAASSDSGKTVKLNNPLVGDEKDVTAIVGNIIKAATGVMGALVLLMIVWGGITWLTAAGNPEKIKSGTNTILWAILGAIVVLGSYLLLTGVLRGLAG